MYMYEFPHLGDVCGTGIRTNGTCAVWEYPVPSAGASAFFTTWSLYYILICVGLMAVYLVMTLVGAGKHQATFKAKVLNNNGFQIIMKSLIAMGALNSIGVLSTSQLMIAKNFGLVYPATKQPLNPSDMENASLTTTFFNKVMTINLNSHVIPGLLGMVLLLLLSLTRQAPRSRRCNFTLAGATILLNLVMVGIWLAVPVKDSNGKSYAGFEKLKYVYNTPPGYFFIIQFALVITLAFIVAFRVA